ncbi:MAG: bifunctional DNA primase/polymerase [Amaricoccus sp.]|uniref:bifunctional DNA primase/polymerase n=1 Tax=Amaricoccus sp. TaxID=1872485 RepID=UPI0033146282
MAPGLFAKWQPQYADVAIPSFPVIDKRPAIRGYLKVGLAGSRDLATKFGDATTFGIPLSRSKITVLDVDTSDERVLADAMSQCGRSPFIVRSGSGNWQAWYRNNGEGRRIRPDPSVPVDILGAGYVVAPPSKVAKGAYTIVEGSLADLPDLPAMGSSLCAKSRTYNCTPSPLASALPSGPAPSPLAGVQPGERNSGLWRYLMAQTPYCDDADALIDVARTAASAFASPLPDDEVIKAALSAWRCEAEGRNWIARGRQRPAPTEPDGLMWESPDAFLLWKVLRFYNAGRARFFIANDMAKTMPPKPWKRERLAAARTVLLDHEHVTLVRRASTGRAAVYAWGRLDA